MGSTRQLSWHGLCELPRPAPGFQVQGGLKTRSCSTLALQTSILHTDTGEHRSSFANSLSWSLVTSTYTEDKRQAKAAQMHLPSGVELLDFALGARAGGGDVTQQTLASQFWEAKETPSQINIWIKVTAI